MVDGSSSSVGLVGGACTSNSVSLVGGASVVEIFSNGADVCSIGGEDVWMGFVELDLVDKHLRIRSG
jgi:hypothetical protein